MADLVYIADLPRSVVLAALYNNAVVEGFPTRTPFDGRMSIAVAEIILRNDGLNVTSVYGRFIGVHFAMDAFDPSEYDERNGNGQTGVAQRIVNHARAVLGADSPHGPLAEATRDFWVAAPASGG